MTTNRADFVPSISKLLESWLDLVKLFFSLLWETTYAFIEGESADSVLCVVFGRWRTLAPKEAVIAEIMDVVQATKDPALVEGLGALIQKACMDPVILARMQYIAYCAERIDRLDSGQALYALRAAREFEELRAGVMGPSDVTCHPSDLLKYVRAELPVCDDISTTCRLLLAMRVLERAAFERITRDKKLSAGEKKHLREEVLIANSIAYASWAESQTSKSVLERLVPQGSGAQGRLIWGVN